MPRFGELLRRERELRKITLREVSEATKINLRYLEMLERNDFRHLPGGVFNKGFVRAYAQYIGVDPEEMINAYLLEERQQGGGAEGPLLRGSKAGGGSDEAEADDAGRESVSRRGVGIAVAIILILIMAAAAWWWWSQRSERPAAPATTDRPAAQEAIPEREGSAAVDSESPSPDPIEDTGANEATVLEAEERPTEPPATPRTTEDGALDDSGTTALPPLPSDARGVEVVVLIVRATTGRVVCDRRVEILEGRAAGASWTLRCRDVVVVDAADGGAVRVGIGGREPTALGPDGVAVQGRDLLEDPS